MIRNFPTQFQVLCQLFSFCLLFQGFSYSQVPNNQSERMARIRARLTNKDSVFAREKADLAFIQLKANDTVADIGSYDGYHPLAYSVFSDSVVFYLNDISTQGFIYFDSIRALCKKLPGAKIASSFAIVIGNDSSTNLPTNQFNKVILRDVLHHFRSQDIMLADIKRIMKPDARLLLFEPLREEGAFIDQLCKGAMTRKRLIALLDKQGFRLSINSDGTEQTKICALPNGSYCWYEFTLKK